MSDELKLTFTEHLEELRRRLLYSLGAVFAGMILSWFFKEALLVFVTAPFFTAWETLPELPVPTLHFASPMEPFIAYLKLSLVSGIFIGSPVVLYHMWRFVAPGLYPKEKKYAMPFVLFSTIMFVGGGVIGYIIVFPIGFRFFLTFSGNIGTVASLVPTIMMNDYLNVAIKLLLAFGVIFELPLFITFMALAGIVNYRQLLKFSRWFIVLSVLLGSLLTPPDVITQICMAIPLVALYFLAVLMAYLFGPKPDEI